MPGRKDCITIKVNGIKEKVQKKVLLSTVMEAYELFKIDHPEVKVGKSTFAHLHTLFLLAKRITLFAAANITKSLI